MRRLLFLFGLVVLFTAQTFNFVPTQPPGTNNNTPASTAFVQNAVSTGGGGVTSFKGRTGAVVPATADYAFNQLSGNISTSQMNNGTGANTSTFWRGDGSWNTPAGGGNVSTAGGVPTQCALWTAATVLSSTACGGGGGTAGFSDYINIKSYGATGDGTCHPLSSVYSTVAAAQAVYSFVNDLTQCIDWASIQKAVYFSYTSAPLTNGSFPVYCPVGNYQLSNPIILSTPTNGTAGSNPAWANGTTYANAALVTYNGLPFISAGSGNVGNPPTLYNGFPASMNLIGGGGSPSGYPYASVTISNASPAVVTVNLATGAGSSSLQVVANQPIVFFTQQFANPNAGSTPVLPTGINANQVYYVIGASINTGAGTFQVSASPGGAAVNTSSAGVGHFFATGQVWQFAPAQTGDNFNIRISFIGSDGLTSNSGCVLQTNGNWTAPAAVVGPGNGNLVRSVTVSGQVAGFGATTTSPNGYRCSAFSSLNGPMQTGNAMVAPIGWAVMSDGGGASKTKFENVGSSEFYIDDYRSYGSAGALVDQNRWEKVNYTGGCFGLYMGSTQSFINTLIDSTFLYHTNSIVAYTQEGVKGVGGIYTTPDSAAQAFTISGAAFVSSCGNFFACVTATITSPDNNFQNPMCSYSAGQANNAQVKWLNSWYFASGCGYNTFMIRTTQWGLIGMYVADYNPFTGAIVLGIPNSFAGIYQGTCCGSNLATQIAAATTLYAVESATHFFGDNQIENVHIEDDGTAMTVSAFATNFFGGARPAEMKDIFLNAEASLGSSICCNQTVNNHFAYKALAQQAIPFINSTVGDTIIDRIEGGNNNQTNSMPMDRVTIALGTNTYLDMRHTMGVNNFQISSGSNGNASGPLYDFQPSSISGFFTSGTPIINPTTLGQMTCGYFAMGGCAFGGGLWDNGSALVPSSVFSVNGSNQPTDQASLWRSNRWGAAPQWGVRPAPWTNPCVLPSQITTLGALPAITYIASLRDFLAVTAGGSGYAVNNVLTLVGGTGTAATVTVTAVGGGGAVTAVTLASNGAYTTIAPGLTTFTSTGGAGSGATFAATGPIWYVNYNIGYPLLWGGTLYKDCNFNGAAALHSHQQNGTGYSYFQNLTTTNVPHLAWTMDGASPFIYMNYEALELMFPGLVFGLVSDGTGGCTAVAQQNFMVLEVKPSLGYVKVVRVDNDGSNYVPSLAASGTTCKNTTLNQAAPSLVTPY